MPVEYRNADNDVLAIVIDQLSRNHPLLNETKCAIGVTMAVSTDDAPAVKHHGAPVLACIKVISARDRTKKNCDAEILIDAKAWERLDGDEQAATIDHELSHLTRVEYTAKQLKAMRKENPEAPAWKLDCHGRPKLKTIPGDFTPSDAFSAVIQRHGAKAIEYHSAKQFKEFVDSARKREK